MRMILSLMQSKSCTHTGPKLPVAVAQAAVLVAVLAVPVAVLAALAALEVPVVQEVPAATAGSRTQRAGDTGTTAAVILRMNGSSCLTAAARHGTPLTKSAICVQVGSYPENIGTI